MASLKERYALHQVNVVILQAVSTKTSENGYFFRQ